jgi:hypothetical protein
MHWLRKIQKYFIHRKKQFKTWISWLAVAKILSQYHKHFMWFLSTDIKTDNLSAIRDRTNVFEISENFCTRARNILQSLRNRIVKTEFSKTVHKFSEIFLAIQYSECENKSLSFVYRNIPPKASIQPWMQNKIRQTNIRQWPRLDRPSQFSHLLPC